MMSSIKIPDSTINPMFKTSLLPLSAADPGRRILNAAKPATVEKHELRYTHPNGTVSSARGKVWHWKEDTYICFHPRCKKCYCQQDHGRVYVAQLCTKQRGADGPYYEIASPVQTVVVKAIDLIKRSKDAMTQGDNFDDPLREIAACWKVQEAGACKSAPAPAFTSAIVKCLGTLRDDSRFYSIMEYAGLSVAEFIAIRNGPLPLPYAQTLFASTVRGIAALHASGAFHRDIKLDNVCVLRDAGSIVPRGTKLIDLGGAYFTDACERLVPGHTPFAPLQFVAPEVLRGEDYDGEKSDVWQLGMFLLCLFTKLRAPVFDSPSRNDTTGRYKVLRNVGVRGLWASLLSEGIVQRDLSASVEEVLTCCLHPNPERRGSVADVLRHNWVKSGLNPGC